MESDLFEMSGSLEYINMKREDKHDTIRVGTIRVGTAYRFCAAILFAAFWLAACSTAAPPPTDRSTKLSVVVTFSILSDLVQQVAGNLIEIRTLVGPGSDTHTFESSPADSVALADASLIFENGASYEIWLDSLYEASRSSAKRIVMSDGIELLKLPEQDSGEHGGDHAGEHGEVDPHIWQNVQNVMKMVEHIRDALVESDPENAASYQENAKNYLAQLQELDGWIEEQVATIPADKRKLVTTHDTFGYFAHRYGFEIVGTAMASASTESAEPAAAEIVALIEQIKAEAVPAVFIENVSNPELMQRIASEAGITVAPPLYTDALGVAGSNGDSYIKMMRYNVTTIVNALGKPKQ